MLWNLFAKNTQILGYKFYKRLIFLSNCLLFFSQFTTTDLVNTAGRIIARIRTMVVMTLHYRF
jgi:hypothetical protein